MLVHCNDILLLKSKSCNTIFAVLNSALAIDMLLKVLFKLLLVIKIILLPFINQQAPSINVRLIDPSYSGVRKFFRININKSFFKTSICSLSFSFILMLLPSCCVLWIGNVFLRLVIVLELDFLDLSHFCHLCIFLFSDICTLCFSSVIQQLSSRLECRFCLAHWMSRVCICNGKIIISVNDNTSLLQDSVRSLSARRLNIPHEVLFITLLEIKWMKDLKIKITYVFESIFDLLLFLIGQIVFESLIESASYNVVSSSSEAVTIQSVRNVGKLLIFPVLLQFGKCHLIGYLCD